MKKKALFLILLILVLKSVAFAQGGIESGLVAKYCFSGNADDALGLRNATVFGASLTTDRFGAPNEAYLLDGINDYIQMPNDIWVSGNFSFTGWLYLNGQDSWARFFEWGNGIDKDNVFYCPYQGGQMVFTIHQCSSSARTYAYNPSTVATGAWIHIAITLTGDTVRVYKNNSFVYSYKMTYIPCAVVRTQCYFGKSNFPNPYLEGKIDDIRIYNRAISTTEIDSIYNLTGCGSAIIDPCAGTVADFIDTATSCYTINFLDKSIAKDSGIVSLNWDFGDLSSSSLKSPTHTYADYGTYNVRLIATDSGGCKDTIIKPITIAYRHFADAGRDTTLCLTNGLATTYLRGNGGLYYSWSPSTLVISPTSKNTFATVSANTSFLLNVTDSFGCKDKDTVEVNLYPNATIKNKPKDTTVCQGTTVQLNASGLKTYQWLPASQVDSANKSNPKTIVNGLKTLIVQGADINGCTSMDTVTLRVHPQVVLSINPKNPIVCEGDTIQINVSGATTYKWYPSEGMSSDSIANPKIYVNGTKTYVVKGTSANGCIGSDSIIINPYPLPKVDAYAIANANVVQCQGDIVTLNVTGASRYQWSPAEYCETPTSATTIVHPTANTVFTVVGINDNGCSSSDTIAVLYDGKEKAVVPNSFTPNNDQINDRIGVVDDCNIKFLSMDIFNRWGQIVFSGYNLSDKWDGTKDGKPCEVGTYFYLIKAWKLNGEPINFKGDITLIR